MSFGSDHELNFRPVPFQMMAHNPGAFGNTHWSLKEGVRSKCANFYLFS